MKNLEIQETEFAIQKNAISRSMYHCSPMSRKIIAMSMSLLTMNKEGNNTVSFDINEFVKALGIKDGSKTRLNAKKAVEDVVKTKVILKNVENDDAGNYIYEGFYWFTKWKFNWDWETCKFTFNPEIAEYIKEMAGFTKLNLIELGKLQSYYAIRFYEIALSYSGFAGTNGNRTGEWWFEYDIDDLRTLFNLEPTKYKMTNEFRRRCVDNPITELNVSDVGFKIKIDYIRKGKSLLGFRFNCKYETKNFKSANPSDEDESLKDIEKYKKLYPEKFQTYFEQEMSQKLLFENPETKKALAELRVVERLKNH